MRVADERQAAGQPATPPPATRANHGWYLVVEDAAAKPPHYNFVRPLTDLEWEDYQQRTAYLHEVAGGRIPFRNLLHAYEEFKRQFAVLEQSDLSVLATRPTEEWTVPLNQGLGSVLTAMRAYLDNARTRLSRSVAAQGVLSAYDAARRACFERSAPYRVTYYLRDYVQHCGPALTATGVRSSWQPATGVTTYALQAHCRRDTLLAGFEWKHAEADLTSLPPTFDVRPLLDPAVQEYARIDYAVFLAEMPTVRVTMDQLEELYDEARLPNGQRAVGRVAKIEEAGVDGATGRQMYHISFVEPPSDIRWP